MVIDALLAKRVQAVEAFWTLVALQTDLACQKLVVDLLRELVTSRGGRRCCGGGESRGGHCGGVYLVDVDGSGMVALSFLSAAIPAGNENVKYHRYTIQIMIELNFLKIG
jgi:hypothetical protein